MSAVVAAAEAELASRPEQLWPWLADTDRMNRALGLGAVDIAPLEGRSDTAARVLVAVREGGFSMKVEEEPFEWSEGRAFSVVRRMQTGPLVRYSAGFRLDPKPTGTRYSVRLEMEPRVALLWPILWFQSRKFASRLLDVARAIDAHLQGGAENPYKVKQSDPDDARIAHGLESLARDRVPSSIVERIGALLRQGADAELVRIRPYEIAARWGEEGRDVLRAMLLGVRAGLFELRWAVICPSCVGGSQQHRMLGELSTEGHCALCDITFELELDRAIEAIFVPHPSVRAVSERPFCTGGPARTPHVVEQRVLTPGGTKAFPVPHETARFRVFVRGGARASVEADPSGPHEVRVAFDGNAIEPCAVTVAPGGAVLLENRAPTPTHAKLERLAYATQAATASRVATLPEFREQFSADLLKRSTPLKVSRVALLFSDLTGSTALYSSLGDAAAFRIVDDHFDVLRSVVEKHGGAVVKTMGDAVMAAFESGAACARASLAALDAFEDFRTSRPHAERIGLKLGMHEGACYVVTANRALDYFGQAVNVASRLQHLACAGELVLHAEEHAALGDEVLDGTVVVERFDAHVKGIDAPLPVVRVRPRSVFAPDTLRSRIQDVTIRSA